MASSAYDFKELDKSFGEGSRLSAQAQAFVDFELPALLKRIPEGARVGDFGCGTGVISAALARHLPKGTVVGLDPDVKALELAQKQGNGIPNVSFEKYGFGEEGLPASAPFDVAFTRLVLLHLPDPAAALRQMGRCLKPGGLLYVVDCDDAYLNFSPKEPWQDEMLRCMALAQASLGGTRTLGSRLLKMVSEAGFWPKGCQVAYYSTENMGRERWKEVFVPAAGGAAEMAFKRLVEQRQLDPAKKAELSGAMKRFFDRHDTLAQLSIWNIWALKI